MVARDFKQNESSVRVTVPQNPLFQLAAQFSSADEIIRDKDQKIKVFAVAMDMEYADCANLMIKLRETYELLNTPLKIQIDGQPTELKHPVSEQPLCVGDVLRDRSGPLFSFPLDKDVGKGFLDASQDPAREAVANSQMQKAQNYAKSLNARKVSKHDIEQAVSVYQSLHKAQGSLTDFDLELKDFAVLEKAIGNALTDKMGKDLPDYLVEDIARSHWVYGGGVKTENVTQALAGDINYAQVEQDRFAEEQHHKKSHRHMLSESAKEYSGQKSALETHRGTAVSFKTQKAVTISGSNGDVLIAARTEQANLSQIESSDAILNSFPIFGKVFNQSQTIDDKHATALTSAMGMDEKQGRRMIADICRETGNHPFNFAQLASDVAQKFPDKKSQIARVAESHKQETQQSNDAHYALEVGRKNSLCQDQLGEPKKLAWNMENTGDSLAGMISQAKAGNQESAAHLQVAKLGYLISLTGWGIDEKNYQTEIGNFTDSVTPEVYQDKINEKSYSRKGSTVRKDMGWADISRKEATQRLSQHNEAFGELKEFALKNGAYFEKVGKLQEATRSGDLEAQKSAMADVSREMKKIVSGMPELQAMLKVNKNQDQKSELASQLTVAVKSTVELNEVRVKAAHSRDTEKKLNAVRKDAAIGTGEYRVVSGKSNLPKGIPVINVDLNALIKAGQEAGGDGYFAKINFANKQTTGKQTTGLGV